MKVVKRSNSMQTSSNILISRASWMAAVPQVLISGPWEWSSMCFWPLGCRLQPFSRFLRPTLGTFRPFTVGSAEFVGIPTICINLCQLFIGVMVKQLVDEMRYPWVSGFQTPVCILLTCPGPSRYILDHSCLSMSGNDLKWIKIFASWGWTLQNSDMFPAKMKMGDGSQASLHMFVL